MTNDQKILNLLGLAMRARKLALGEEQIIKDIQHKNAKLVIIAEDTGHNTNKNLHDKCAFYKVPIRTFLDRDQLSHAIGKSGRVAVAVLDEGFSKKLLTMIDQ